MGLEPISEITKLTASIRDANRFALRRMYAGGWRLLWVQQEFGHGPVKNTDVLITRVAEPRSREYTARLKAISTRAQAELFFATFIEELHCRNRAAGVDFHVGLQPGSTVTDTSGGNHVTTVVSVVRKCDHEDDLERLRLLRAFPVRVGRVV